MCCSPLFLVVAGEALDVVGVRLVSYYLYFDGEWRNLPVLTLRNNCIPSRATPNTIGEWLLSIGEQLV
jgi:hypothetical protein